MLPPVISATFPSKRTSIFSTCPIYLAQLADSLPPVGLKTAADCAWLRLTALQGDVG
jgi:hypothetical protein